MDAELAVAHVDVAALGSVNELQGHAVGDALLRSVADSVRERLRAYDLIVRLGGDVFLCALPGVTVEDARNRFADVQTALAEGEKPHRINVGIAVLEPDDTAADLIKRARTDVQDR